MEIQYDPHLVERLSERNIPEDWPRDIILNSTEHYFDQMTGLHIVIESRQYKGREREMAVSYTKSDSEIKAITIHPLGARQKENRVQSGRWSKHENT